MDSLKNYLLSVVCAAITCAIAGSMMDKKGTTGALMKLITGIFLVFTVISPIASLEIEEISIFTDDLREDAVSAAALGQSMTKESMAGFIKQETEAYILDKATVLNVQLDVEVSLGDDLQPESAKLCGAVSPYAQFRLENILTEELGIAKENQQWNE